MLPRRLVIDTNVVVSAALNPEGLQRTVLLLAITKPARLYVSEAVLDEYAGVLSRPRLHIRKGIRQQLLQLIKNHSHIVARSRRLEVCSDPDDNRFIECADAARADYLITGNQRHFPILEENQDHQLAWVHEHRGSPSHSVRRCRALCGLTARTFPKSRLRHAPQLSQADPMHDRHERHHESR